eukprot:s899_g4.t1
MELVQHKLAKLRGQLQEMQNTAKVPHKALEACPGLRNWATTLSKHLRPFMAPLYKDLHSAKGTLRSIAPATWSAFYDCFDSAAQLSKAPPGSWLPWSAQLLEVGSIEVHSKADVPQVPPSHKHQWVRLADPSRQEIHLRKESKFSLQWLSLCKAHEQPRTLRSAPLMHCMSAADAFADKDRMGIGGWLGTAKHFVWFSEIFTAAQVRAEWPQLVGSLQPYIGCFETLAQLALAHCSWQLLRARRTRFVLPSASDNTSAESGLNKLLSTAEPLGTFLRLAATWAHLQRVQFQVEHLAGEKKHLGRRTLQRPPRPCSASAETAQSVGVALHLFFWLECFWQRLAPPGTLATAQPRGQGTCTLTRWGHTEPAGIEVAVSAKEGAYRIARTAKPLRLATLCTDTASLAEKEVSAQSSFFVRIHVPNIENARCVFVFWSAVFSMV